MDLCTQKRHAQFHVEKKNSQNANNMYAYVKCLIFSDCSITLHRSQSVN